MNWRETQSERASLYWVQTVKDWRKNWDVIFDQEQVEEAIRRMSIEISTVLYDSNPIVLVVMNGGIVVAGPLLLRLRFPLEVDYCHATRYGHATEGSKVFWHSKPPATVSGRTVLVLDDILDEGHTLEAITDECVALGAHMVYHAVLVEKMHARPKASRAAFVGLRAPDRFLFGMGMDLKGYERNLSMICALRDG